MVSFVCDRCQDTVKKPKLDQHANSCGGPFSCVDCSVSFQGTDYRAHTSCISEAEKYQKALYKGPKSKPATPAPKAKAEEVEEAPVSEKKLSKEEKKKLKAEKKASKGGEEDKMEVDEPEAVEAASPEPASEKKLSKEEKKKLKAEKKSGKTEEKAEEKTEVDFGFSFRFDSLSDLSILPILTSPRSCLKLLAPN
jgi:cell growth-regulating nucleolar protein